MTYNGLRVGRRRFGMAGGRHTKRRKERSKQQRTSTKIKFAYQAFLLQNFPRKTGIKISRRVVSNSYQRYSRSFECKLEGSPVNFCMRKISSDKSLKYKIKKVQQVAVNGYRVINLDSLQDFLTAVTTHVAQCPEAINLANKGQTAIVLKKELRTCGLASVLESHCTGCNEAFIFETSPKLKMEKSKRYDVNVRAVWGSTVSGNGNAHLSEILSTLDSPSLSQPAYTSIEQEIGNFWSAALQEQFMEAAEQERQIAIEKGRFHEGVPCITVITDGGWCKRAHKHSYNALGGVGIIIGKETGKILHMGVRNKYCYICSRAEEQGVHPSTHTCFKNWNESSQAMEADIIAEGFKNAEKDHGLRYTELIADGDSSVFAKIQEEVPVWGRAVKKTECANHACKCLRSSLEKLVQDHPQYKGKSKLTKYTRVRIVSAVRCAIRMRSREVDRMKSAQKLAHDIRNSVHHIFGNHSKCSDFCKAKITTAIPSSDSTPQNPDNDMADPQTLDDVFQHQSDLWNAGCSFEDQEESRLSGSLTCQGLDSEMLRDVTLLLNRLADKSSRLIGNNTTNLAECWMHMRSKFDGGKIHNLCNRGSWNARCYAGSLRMNVGPNWSPNTFKKCTGSEPGLHFKRHYKKVEKQVAFAAEGKKKPEAQKRRWKRKMASSKESGSKKARLSYGKEALDVTPDMDSATLEGKKKMFLESNINISEERMNAIERMTIDQSNCTYWKSERKKRLTASIFSSIAKRSPKIAIEPLVRRLLYSNFKGTQATRRGLAEEDDTIHEYKLKQADAGVNVMVSKSGLVISRNHKFLAGSPDGVVHVADTNERGLLEIKNVLQTKKINLTQAAKQEKQFCLKLDSKHELYLPKQHSFYYQCQGLLFVTEMQWIDFVVRTVRPYQLHIERIQKDEQFCKEILLPKLSAFYFKVLLPELCAPRHGKLPGIREPGIWFEKETAAVTTTRKPTRSRQTVTRKAKGKSNHPYDDSGGRRLKPQRKSGTLTRNLDAASRGTQPVRREFFKCD